MTIGKKLYAGFGLIVGVLAFLSLVNIITGYMVKSALNTYRVALESKSTLESVRN